MISLNNSKQFLIFPSYSFSTLDALAHFSLSVAMISSHSIVHDSVVNLQQVVDYTAPAGAMQEGSGMFSVGRVHVFTGNYGLLTRSALWRQQLDHLVRKNPGHILVLQEANSELQAALQEHGWLTSPAEWVGGVTRTRITPQLLVAGWPVHCQPVHLHEDLSGSHHHASGGVRWGLPQLTAADAAAPAGHSQRSFWMAATVPFNWEMAGLRYLTVLNIHIHSQTAGRGAGSPFMLAIAQALARSIRSSGARLMCGDANKAIFYIRALLENEGVQCTLVARHCGFSIVDTMPGQDHRDRRNSMLHDTCGIWVLGPHAKIRPLSCATRCVISALHPALVERVPATRAAPAGVKPLTRGFKRDVFPNAAESPELEDVPGEDVVDLVLRIWAGHRSAPLDPVRDIWAMCWPNVESGTTPAAPAGGPPPTGAASSTDPAPPPPPQVRPPAWQVRTEADRDVQEAERITRDHLQVLQLLPEDTMQGDRFSTLMEMLGAPICRETIESRRSSGGWSGRNMATTHWPMFPILTEVPCYGEQWDPNGGIWGRHGHYPLLVAVGSQRSASAEGHANKAVTRGKKQRWQARGEVSWPWWTVHESERSYWSVGNESSGRGWSGSSYHIFVSRRSSEVVAQTLGPTTVPARCSNPCFLEFPGRNHDCRWNPWYLGLLREKTCL